VLYCNRQTYLRRPPCYLVDRPVQGRLPSRVRLAHAYWIRSNSCRCRGKHHYAGSVTMSPHGVSVNGTRVRRALHLRLVCMHFQSSNKETITGVPQNRALCNASCQGIVARERSATRVLLPVDSLTHRAGMLVASLLFANLSHLCTETHSAEWHCHLAHVRLTHVQQLLA